ncbi:hypothetical protein [Streptomyces rhizosphaericola]|uniref:hypothetical protein n=1 Tax=Streptomyces rhizosphaericola TaxID=2564098 RepID=UPI0039F10F87
MSRTGRSRLLVVDFDFFFHNPLQGAEAAHRGDPLLYDWAHAETPFLQEDVWTYRAEDFIQAGVEPPRCEGLDGFWDRFTFAHPQPPLFYADSNTHAGALTPAHYALPGDAATAWQEVHLFDAHHDSGYPHHNGPTTFEEWSEEETYSCEDWMLVHHAQGSRLTLTYPAWRPEGDSHPPMVPLTVSVDDRTAAPGTFDAVFLCRSGAWVPSWCDDQFTQLLQAFPGQPRPFPGARWAHPRPDPLPLAHRYAAIRAELTATLHTATQPARQPGAEPQSAYEEVRAAYQDPDTLQTALETVAEIQAASHQRQEQTTAALATPKPGTLTSLATPRTNPHDASPRAPRDHHPPVGEPEHKPRL